MPSEREGRPIDVKPNVGSRPCEANIEPKAIMALMIKETLSINIKLASLTVLCQSIVVNTCEMIRRCLQCDVPALRASSPRLAVGWKMECWRGGRAWKIWNDDAVALRSPPPTASW